LSSLFDLRPLAKESAGDLKDSRAVTAHNLLERPLILRARKAHQFQVRSLFDLDSQGRS
jgi:hypothetical protein